MISDPMAFRDVAWNGIRCRVPSDWEISTMGRRYLFLESPKGPELELRWEPVKGRFSHGRQLKRLALSQRKGAGKTIIERPLPVEWETPLAPFDATCFEWSVDPLAGIGVVLYCPDCGIASLIQFFDRNPANRIMHGRVLDSFREHSRQPHTLWAVYDIRARTPGGFRLDRYRFSAGAFELAFDEGGRRISLYRWGPADFLLRNRSLEAFAETVFRLPRNGSESIHINGFAGRQWKSDPPENPLGRLLNRIRLGDGHRWFRLWHIRKKNRILGVGMEGHSPPDPELMETLCADYETL